MYIDGLTITALVVFTLCLAGFLGFCALNICGLSPERKQELRERFIGEDRS